MTNSIMKSTLVNVFFIVLTYFLLYGPRLKLIDLYLSFNAAFALYGIASLVIYRRVNKKLFCVFLLVSVNVIYYSFLVILKGAFDLFLYWWAGSFSLYLFSAYGLYILYSKAYVNTTDKILHHVFYASCINAVITIIIFLSPGFASFALSITNLQSNQEMWMASGKRSFDLSMGGGAVASITFAISFVIGLFTIKRKHIFKSVSLLAIVIATLLTGRSGFLILSAVFIIYLVSRLSLKAKVRDVVFVIIFVALCFAIAPMVVGFLIEKYPAFYYWAFELFINRGSSSSTDAIVNNMFILPEGVINIIFGAGTFGRNDYVEYVYSDVGYIRMIWGGGLVGMILMLSPIIYVFFVSINKYLKSKSKISIIFIIVFLIYAIANMKELHYMNRGSFIIFSILLVLLIKSKNMRLDAR